MPASDVTGSLVCLDLCIGDTEERVVLQPDAAISLIEHLFFSLQESLTSGPLIIFSFMQVCGKNFWDLPAARMPYLDTTAGRHVI